MELILSTISAGGLVGAANQYLCLLIVAIAARFNLITLSDQTAFLSSYWFIGITAFLWLITLAPAYSSLLSPGIGNAINTVSNLISGFLVPVSSAIISLAAIGVIVNLNPDMKLMLETFKILTQAGNFGPTGYVIAAGGAVSATALTGLRALAKPAISTSTGTAGTISAPVYATLENIFSIVLMGIAYILAKVNPWLLVAIFIITALFIVAMVVFAISQFRKLRTGIGKVLYLAQINPRAGLAIIVEFFVWGIGWMTWKQWGRGVLMLFFLALWGILFLIVQPMFVSIFAFLPPVVPAIGFISIVALIMIYFGIGLRSASRLMNYIENSMENKATTPG
ncbi:MAG: DUF4126 family protein [Chloroflexi bacterium]|nr:DUF4126 family protein [Chloroflexota bacterium]